MHGRQRELAQLNAIIAAARGGRAQVLVLTGEPGIGKTTLLDATAQAAAGVRVLRTTGLPAETQVGFVCLADLLTPILGHRDRLPAAQRHAIERALALGSDQPSAGDGRLGVRIATLALLAAAAEEAATLVIVDDAQWVDQESVEALAFAARRLATDRIGFLFAVRVPPGAPPQASLPVPALAGFPVLRLTGLDRETSDALLATVAPHLTDPVVRDAVLATAAGNPLALQEIPRLLGTTAVASTVLARPLPVGSAIRQSVGKVLATFDTRTRMALLVAATSQDPRWADGDAGLKEIGLSHADLEPAENAGLIHLGDEPGFRHPLVRAAVYHEAPASDRRAAHRALAAAAAGNQAAEMRASHLAAAALAKEAAASARDPLARARAEQVLATAWNISGDARRATRLLSAAADRVAGIDDEFSVSLRLAATGSALHCGDHHLADAVSRDAAERSASVGGELQLAAQIARGWVRFCRAEADPDEPFGVPLPQVLARTPNGPGVLPFVVLALPWLEYYDQAQEVLDRIQSDNGTTCSLTRCRLPAPSTPTSPSVPGAGPPGSPPPPRPRGWRATSGTATSRRGRSPW